MTGLYTWRDDSIIGEMAKDFKIELKCEHCGQRFEVLKELRFHEKRCDKKYGCSSSL